MTQLEEKKKKKDGSNTIRSFVYAGIPRVAVEGGVWRKAGFCEAPSENAPRGKVGACPEQTGGDTPGETPATLTGRRHSPDSQCKCS